MSIASALILYPSWAIAVLLAATAARLGRSTGRGLLALCLVLGLWVTALILFATPATRSIGERVIPAGMLLAGAFVHAGEDVAGRRGRFRLLGYGWGTLVGLVGAIAPRLLYTRGMTAAGPMFWPIAVASALGAVVILGWMARETSRQRGRAQARMLAILVGNLLGISAGGGAILLRVTGVVTDLRITAPLLLASVVLIGGAVLAGEHGRARQMVRQGLVYAILTAAFSAVGLTAFFALLPDLLPAGTRGVAWTALIVFLAALPLDPVRLLIVEGIGRRLYREPIGVPDLADAAARSEIRADHAERLAEIGAITSAVAHEIRNPIGVIAAQAKVLERAGAPAASVASLRDQVERARRFVDDLLRYGQPRPLELRDVEVRAAIETAVSSVLIGGVEITIDAAPELRVEADRAALVDVLIALLQNAAIAAGDRPGATVRVGARRAADAIVIVVEDDGPGVPAALEGRLFEPFVTGRGRDHRHPGTGLGLAIARRSIERHGGTLAHERPTEGGARLVIRLPRVR